MTVKRQKMRDPDTGEAWVHTEVKLTEGDPKENADAIKSLLRAATPSARLARIAAWHADAVQKFDPDEYPELREIADLIATPPGDYQLIAADKAEGCRQSFERRVLLRDARKRRSKGGKQSAHGRKEENAERDARIRKRHAQGAIVANLARSFKLSESQIRRILGKK